MDVLCVRLCVMEEERGRKMGVLFYLDVVTPLSGRDSVVYP